MGNIKWDVGEIVRAAGGPTALRELLLRYNDNDAPSVSTIGMWANRGSIPGRWSAAVIYAMTQEGLSLPELLTPGLD